MKNTQPALTVGKAYNVNGTMLWYRWTKFSVSARQMVHFFSNGYFNHTLREDELASFVITA